jgi:phage baseplate assembly protein W
MTHIAFPFRIDGRGRTTATTDVAYVRELVEQLVFTAAGERVNRPTLGSGLLALVHEPARADLATATQLLVQGALQQWLGDVLEVGGVDVTSGDGALVVTVRYRLRRTGEVRVDTFRQAAP